MVERVSHQPPEALTALQSLAINYPR